MLPSRVLSSALQSLGRSFSTHLGAASTRSSTAAATVCSSSHILEEGFQLMGRRDKRTKRGKIFKGSYGKSRPGKKTQTNPYLLPQQPDSIPIPFPPQPQQPLLPSAAAAAAALNV